MHPRVWCIKQQPGLDEKDPEIGNNTPYRDQKTNFVQVKTRQQRTQDDGENHGWWNCEDQVPASRHVSDSVGRIVVHDMLTPAHNRVPCCEMGERDWGIEERYNIWKLYLLRRSVGVGVISCT